MVNDPSPGHLNAQVAIAPEAQRDASQGSDPILSSPDRVNLVDSAEVEAWVADRPEITESFPMSEEQKVFSPFSGAFFSSSTSVPEVGERVRAYLEQHGWPEEYDAEFLLEHYALLDWLAVQLSFPEASVNKQLSHLWASKPSDSDPSFFKKSPQNLLR